MAVGYFIDIQGTLLSDADKSPIKGAVEFLEHLNKTNVPYILVTNNTKEQSSELINSLQDKGLKFEKRRFIDPLMVLKEKVGESLVMPFGSSKFCDVLPQFGLNVVKQKPDAILIASHDNFNANEYASMIDEVLKGAKVIAMHGTSTYVKNGKRHPGVGAILAMLEYATGVKGEVVGKPSSLFYKKAYEILKEQNASLKIEDVIMVSDDAIGDLAGAKDMGIQTSLVLSGKCKSIDEAKSVESKIDKIYVSVANVLEELK